MYGSAFLVNDNAHLAVAILNRESIQEANDPGTFGSVPAPAAEDLVDPDWNLADPDITDPDLVDPDPNLLDLDIRELDIVEPALGAADHISVSSESPHWATRPVHEDEDSSTLEMGESTGSEEERNLP